MDDPNNVKEIREENEKATEQIPGGEEQKPKKCICNIF